MMIRKIKQISIFEMDNKDFEATDGFAAVLWRRLTFEEIQKNKRTAMEMLLTLPKEQLVDYIFGKTI